MYKYMKKRIIILGHGEEPHPKQKKINKVQSRIGLNHQGAIRALMMPELLKTLLGEAKYELHTYTHNKNNIPTSRSFYTTQFAKNKILICDKSNQVDLLIKNVLNSKAQNIVICWEHTQIPLMLKQLIDQQP